MAANLRVSSTNDQEPSHGGHGILEIKDVIDHLSVAGIPSYIVGTRALRYHGALGRAADDWDVCIPTSQLEPARQLFDGVSTFRYSTTTNNDDNTLDANPSSYERADPPRRTPNSNRHDHPRFKLKNYNFYFVLVPSSDFLPEFMPVPTSLESDEAKASPNIEYSPLNKIPYPTRKQLARALLFQGNWSDLDDFIDGTNVDVQWGLENVDFEAVSELQAGLRGGLARGSGKVLSAAELESRWRREASREEKDKRMGEDKKGRWVTRWLRVESGDGSGGRGSKGLESV